MGMAVDLPSVYLMTQSTHPACMFKLLDDGLTTSNIAT